MVMLLSRLAGGAGVDTLAGRDGADTLFGGDDQLSVALVIVLSIFILGERLTWAKGVGGLLIVAGAITIALE